MFPSSLLIKYCFNLKMSIDRVNEFSDEDEEGEFSSTEENYDNVGLTGYATKRDMRKYSKLDRSENDADDGALGTNPVDSDSEFENLKEKGSRSKISRVSTIIVPCTSYQNPHI